MDPAADTVPVGSASLDPERGVLRRADGEETTLRPKTLDLLLLLLRSRGRLVTRAEILDTVWADVTVTDDSITQCIVELRRAMGAEGMALLKTVPRRGYILEAAAVIPVPVAAPDGAPPPRPVFAAEGLPAVAPRPALSRIAFLAAIPAVLALAWLGLAPGTPPAPPVVAAAAPPPQPAPPVATVPAPPVAVPAPSAREQAIELIEAARRRNIAPGDRRANWVAARGLLQQALALDPENPRAHAEIVFTYSNTVLNGFSLNPAADLRIAEDHAERAIALGPNLPATHAARAAVMRQQRRWEEALASYRRGVELDPTQHSSRANGGLMLLFLGQPEAAEAQIRTTMALAPPGHGFRLTWLTYLSLALAHQQRWAEAVEAMRASLDGQAFMPVPVRLALLSGLLARLGEWEAARIAATQAMAQNAEVTIGWFRAQPLSDHPGFLARQEPILVAMREAGLAE
ncbi:winged helix-turn-helix domain-containing protein [Falsiroseomonas ponticola]|uniref:winged helix-turn-helix domain-containing protein n=1 Tax=Falsiroseomonas ponticola TaxID=2786951 RepID=UPI001932DB5D|nr:winged helix-turn-helix domain-containing protein [Roseomonas ponticola]